MPAVAPGPHERLTVGHAGGQEAPPSCSVLWHEERGTRGFLAARPKVSYDAMAACLREAGGERWLERLGRDQLGN